MIRFVTDQAKGRAYLFAYDDHDELKLTVLSNEMYSAELRVEHKDMPDGDGTYLEIQSDNTTVWPNIAELEGKLTGWLAHSRKHNLDHVCIPCNVADQVLQLLKGEERR